MVEIANSQAANVTSHLPRPGNSTSKAYAVNGAPSKIWNTPLLTRLAPVGVPSQSLGSAVTSSQTMTRGESRSACSMMPLS